MAYNTGQTNEALKDGMLATFVATHSRSMGRRANRLDGPIPGSGQGGWVAAREARARDKQSTYEAIYATSTD